MITRRVWFYRYWTARYGGSNGGNLKVRDAFDAVDAEEGLEAMLCVDPKTVWNSFPGNHWLNIRSRSYPRLDLRPGDVLFLSGKDWQCLTPMERENSPVPIVNIVQPRHTRKHDPRNAYLQHPAIRIAKSQEGLNRLRDHGVNGPIKLIPDSIDLGLIPKGVAKDIDVLIVGLKDPEMAKEVDGLLKDWATQYGLKVHLQLPPKLPRREDFLLLLSRAKMAICIPLPMSKGGEGFYLPPLEAMASETLVVTSLAIGNVNHCLGGYNCAIADNNPASFARTAQELYTSDYSFKKELLNNGLSTADKHKIEVERSSLIDLIKNAYSMWGQMDIGNK